MGQPHTPTAAQLAQLATLAATARAALNSHTTAINNHVASGAAWLIAQKTAADYQAYIYGGQKPGVYDEGSPNVT